MDQSLIYIDDAVAANVYLSTLQDQCLYYIIRHIDEFHSELALLPLAILKKLLLNLPAVDIWRLEALGVTQSLDVESLWRSLIEDRCGHVSSNRYNHPFYQKMPARDLYFMFVWYEALQDKNLYSRLGRCEEGRDLSMLLYSVPCVLGISDFSLSKKEYCPTSTCILRNVVLKDPLIVDQRRSSPSVQSRVFWVILRYFTKVCCMSPRYICFHCPTVGRHLHQDMQQSLAVGAVLQEFMVNLEMVRFDGHGILVGKIRTSSIEQYKTAFVSLPSLFLGSALANPQCGLHSIEIDVIDASRMRSVLNSVSEAVSSVGYTKVQSLSVRFTSVSCTTLSEHNNHKIFGLLSLIDDFVEMQLLLKSLVIHIPERNLHNLERLKNTMAKIRIKGYSDFVLKIQDFMKRPQFQLLSLRILFSLSTTQQLIRTFLSLPLSHHSQVLDIRFPEDIVHQSDSLLPKHCDNPVKSLEVSGISHDDGEENLSSVVFQNLLATNTSLYYLVVIDSINGIASALKQPLENLQVQNLSLVLRKIIRIPAGDNLVGRAPSYIPADKPDIHQERGLPDLPRIDALISNSFLLTLRICFISPNDFMSNSLVPGFLRIISDGLHSPFCNVRTLTLPKLDCPPDNVKDFQYFCDSVFSLPHIDSFELNLSFVMFPELYATTLVHLGLEHCLENRGKRLAKLVLQCDTVEAMSHDDVTTLMKGICNDFVILKKTVCSLY